MANTDAPVGLWPRPGTGGDTTAPMRQFDVADGYTTAIGMGCVVQLAASGRVERLRANTNTNIVGVAAHFVSRTGTGRTLNVFYDPRTEFEVQVDDASVTSVSIAIGANFSLVNFNTYNSTNQRSIAEVDGGTQSNVVTGLDKPVRCIALSRRIDKDELSASWTGLIVKLQPGQHVFAKTSNTV